MSVIKMGVPKPLGPVTCVYQNWILENSSYKEMLPASSMDNRQFMGTKHCIAKVTQVL